MNSFIPWVGGKGKLLWIINKLMPDRYTRFIDVFGGSGTVTMCRPIQRGCMEVYNDFNGNLTNLFCCVKNRPMALLAELGFLPLNTRDDFNILYKFFSRGEFTDDYLQEEMDLTEVYLKPPDAEAIRALMLERTPRGSIRRAADFFKLIRYSFSGGAKSFGGKPCDIRRFFHLIWECSRRLANVIVENKDFEEVIRQYDRAGAVIYCDPPYYKAESCYEVEFPPEDHQRLHDVLVTCEGYFIVSYFLLGGIGLASLFSSFMLIMAANMDNSSYQLVARWLAGNIWGTSWHQVLALLPYMLILVPFLLTKSNILDILLLGENTAISLGIAVERELRLLLIASVALTSACVAVSGGIGFVGLVAPHMARRLIGGRHHALMPASMLLGALLLLLADTLGRSAFQPRDIPVGIVISVLSAPYFLFLLRRYF